MNKSELLSHLAKDSGLTVKETNVFLNSFVKVVTKVLSKKDKVSLVGFGTFVTVDRAERNGVNPLTGKALKIPAKTAPKFRAGKSLRDAVAGVTKVKSAKKETVKKVVKKK